ncbi:MAG: hypothetical protein IK115_05280 [Lachnospiraceae bacterium]|nr:hypothetical protein [Lachnospiraceae bacterium]
MREERRWLVIIWKIFRAILVGLALAGLIFGAFFWFRIKSDGHFALRNAKNVRFAIETVGIEYYGDGRSIYSADSPDGMRRGAKEKVQRLAGEQGDFILEGYDAPGNMVLQMKYTEGNYVVIFGMDESGNESWSLKYLLDLDLL